MIKLSVCPQHRIVALLARGWEAGMGYRTGRRVVVVLMAADAGGAGDVVVVVDVAVGTQPGRHGVRAGQNESRSRVIEFPVCP